MLFHTAFANSSHPFDWTPLMPTSAYFYPVVRMRGYPSFPWPNVCTLSAPSRCCLLNHQVPSTSDFRLGQQPFDKYLAAFSPSWQSTKCWWMYTNSWLKGEAMTQKSNTCSPHLKQGFNLCKHIYYTKTEFGQVGKLSLCKVETSLGCNFVTGWVKKEVLRFRRVSRGHWASDRWKHPLMPILFKSIFVNDVLRWSYSRLGHALERCWQAYPFKLLWPYLANKYRG